MISSMRDPQDHGQTYLSPQFEDCHSQVGELNTLVGLLGGKDAKRKITRVNSAVEDL